MYKAGRINLDDMVTRQYRLEQINEGMAALKTGEVARQVIAF